MDPSTDILSVTSPPLQTLQQIIIAKSLYLVSVTILILEHLLTLPDEILYVWNKPKTFILWLFLAIRYYAIAALTVVGVGYFSTLISGQTCVHWAQFLPLGVTMPLSIGPSILLTVRVYAMYGRSKFILGLLGTILCAQFAAGLWQYTVKGGRVAPDPINNYVYHYCVYLPPARLKSVASMYVLIELTFNGILFLLTLARTFWIYSQQRSMNRASSLLMTLVGNGAMYFGVIFCTNLTWALMILHAPTGLRGVMSQPTAVFTTIMMSRIFLNLRQSLSVQAFAYATPRRMNDNHPRKVTGTSESESGREYIPLEIISNGSQRLDPKRPGTKLTA